MKNSVLILVIIFGSVWSSFGQYIPFGMEDKAMVNAIPKEKAYVHTNTQLFFVGEYLYYSLNCLNAETLLPSNVSTIGYVELIGEDKEVVFRQKLRLKNGKAQGDYFIPVNLPSGTYKIIGYTKWMLNFNSFFNDEISIINPYQINQNLILSDEDTILKDSSTPSTDKKFRIDLDGKSFAKRQKVTFRIKNNSGLKGNTAISIRHVSPIKSNEGKGPNSLSDEIGSNSFSKNRLLLPELRGELISGRIEAIHDSISVENLKVSLSIPNGSGYIFKLAITKLNGTFYFNLNKEYNTINAVYQVVDQNKNNYKVILDDHPVLDYSGLIFGKLLIAKESKNQILNRSIHNQIENSYFKVKPDSILTNKPSSTFNHEDMFIYNLDDYTRFKSLKETFVEVVENAWTEKRNEKYVFQVRSAKKSINPTHSLMVLEPLVLIDGVLSQDHELLMDYDARKVKSIGIIQERYVYGSQVYQGIIMIQTISGDFKLNGDGKTIINKELFAPLIQKNYFKQIYSNETEVRSDRIPDFRYQLYWDPNFEINEEEQIVNFYTSDVSGKFIISIAGFSDEGKPIFTNHIFSVR